MLLLVTFVAVQPWATCPIHCLRQNHAMVMSMAMDMDMDMADQPQPQHQHQQPHQHHAMLCHNGAQVRSQQAITGTTGDMLAMSSMPTESAPLRSARPTGPRIDRGPLPDLSSDTPPPRLA